MVSNNNILIKEKNIEKHHENRPQNMKIERKR